MTARDQMLTALAGGQPSEHVPLWEIEFHVFDRYVDAPLILGRTFAHLTPAEQESALQHNAEVLVTVAQRLGHSALTSPGSYWEVAPGVPAYYWLPGDFPWKQLGVLRRTAGAELAIIKNVSGMIMPPSGADYEAFCYRLFDTPEEIDQLAQTTLERGLADARRARDLGADAVMNACDIADNHGVFFNPKQFARFWEPYLHRWTTAVREMGLYSILHSDGDLTAILTALAASDLHALQAIDPIAGMDIVAVKRRVGERLCLCGNMDCGLLQFGPVERIAAETARICEAVKPGGRFVLGASNAVFAEIPLEHYEAMLAAWRVHGRY
jgi:uroporphyrinogen decarboxylase